MSVLKRLVSRVARRQLSRIDGLYQRHAGQECYVFGNGISLKWMDLHQFADRPSIVGGVLLYHKEACSLHIPYCVSTEPFIFYPVFHYRDFGLLRNYLHKEFARSIVKNPQTLFFVNLSNYPVARFSNAMFVSRWYVPPFEDSNPFRDRDDSHRGTLAFQLSLAIYLGFRKVYLVGHDYTHFPSRLRHFYEKGEGILGGQMDSNKNIIGYAKQHIDLVTVTVDASSGLMDHITYKDLTGKEPHFRENVEIVDTVKLENLATWPGYSIF